MFAIVALGVVATLAITLSRLNTRLDTQEQANQATLQVSQSIVTVNDRVTKRLKQLDALTGTADKALAETKALAPLLTELQQAVKPVAVAVTAGRAGGELSEAKLSEVESVLTRLRKQTLALVGSAQAFGSQGNELLKIVKSLVDDVAASVEAAKRINKSLPG
ncbi:hypothetical protein ABZV31_37510 [Streptomyces sp. NPDC005202]|uniref:hypothetical protein n=1 Tax=Streptomyces sp. NPDC005202 TaxID=3157021 RepID=UPI0033A49D6D